MAVESNIIDWNVPNWITIILMAAIGFAFLGFLQNWYTSRKGVTS